MIYFNFKHPTLHAGDVYEPSQLQDGMETRFSLLSSKTGATTMRNFVMMHLEQELEAAEIFSALHQAAEQAVLGHDLGVRRELERARSAVLRAIAVFKKYMTPQRIKPSDWTSNMVPFIAGNGRRKGLTGAENPWIGALDAVFGVPEASHSDIKKQFADAAEHRTSDQRHVFSTINETGALLRLYVPAASSGTRAAWTSTCESFLLWRVCHLARIRKFVQGSYTTTGGNKHSHGQVIFDKLDQRIKDFAPVLRSS